FSRRLRKLDSKIGQIKNLVVINSTDSHQRSWTSEDWHKTAFGHYLVEGLKGDGKPGSGRVNALELFNYVERKLKRSAKDNQGAAQTPVLLPSGEAGKTRAAKIALTVVENSYDSPSLPDTAAGPPAELEKAWADAEDLLDRVPSPAVYS